MPTETMTYAASGVNYDLMDPYKRMAQIAGLDTEHFVDRFGFKVVKWTRGESVFVVETPMGYIGFVVEGLGTKSLAADAMYELTKLAQTMAHLQGTSFYGHVGQCNGAMAFNDMVTLGLLPVVYGKYTAVGESEWFEDELRAKQLIAGTKRACELARCAWGCGETPTLRGIIDPHTTDLAGATWGFAPPNRLIDPSRIRHGDAIVVLESSGPHANGFTMARKIAAKLSPDPKHPELGYLTQLDDGRTYGEALLDPTYIYVGFVEDCLEAGIEIHYCVNITGHGWRKLMRARQPFTYIIEELPWPKPIFDFIQRHGPVDNREAYSNFNMGAGFALYVPQSEIPRLFQVHRNGEYPYQMRVAGRIAAGDKKVVIKPIKGLEFSADTLAVR